MIIGAFGKYVSIMPISFVLGVTAIKDAFEVREVFIVNCMLILAFVLSLHVRTTFRFRIIGATNLTGK